MNRNFLLKVANSSNHEPIESPKYYYFAMHVCETATEIIRIKKEQYNPTESFYNNLWYAEYVTTYFRKTSYRYSDKFKKGVHC